MSENKDAKTKQEESNPSEATGLAKDLEEAFKVAKKVQKRMDEMSRVDESRLRAIITI